MQFARTTFLGLLALIASAAKADTWTDPATTITWSYEWCDGGCRVSGCDHCFGQLEIPSVISGIVVREIKGESFFACSSITSVKLPETLRTIHGGAFAQCDGIRSLEIPWRVSEFGRGAFSGCLSLVSITVQNGNTSFIAVDDCLLSADGKKVHLIPCGKTEVVIPSSVVTVCGTLLYGSERTTDITLPGGVRSVEDCAFANSGLKRLVFNGDAPSSVGIRVLDDTPDDLIVSVPVGSTGWPSDGFWCGRKLVVRDVQEYLTTCETNTWHDAEGRLIMDSVHTQDELRTRRLVCDGDGNHRVDNDTIISSYVTTEYDEDGNVTWASVDCRTTSVERIYWDQARLMLTETHSEVSGCAAGVPFGGWEEQVEQFNNLGLITNEVRHSENNYGTTCDIQENVGDWRYDEMGREIWVKYVDTISYVGYDDISDMVVRQETEWSGDFGFWGFNGGTLVDTTVYGDGTSETSVNIDGAHFDGLGRVEENWNCRETTNRLGNLSWEKRYGLIRYDADDPSQEVWQSEEFCNLENGREAVTLWEWDLVDAGWKLKQVDAWESCPFEDKAGCSVVQSGEPAIVQADSAEEAIDKTIVKYSLPIDEWGNPVMMCHEYRRYFSIAAEEVSTGTWLVSVGLDSEKIGLSDSVEALGLYLGEIADGTAESIVLPASDGLCYSLLYTNDLASPMVEGERVMALWGTVELPLPPRGEGCFFKVKVSEGSSKEVEE